ncbi:MAG: FAD-dependent oxidoreductase, partial [Aeromicrobium sp.]
MTTIEVDLLVLGWGKAGKTLAGALGRAGRTVALVERSATMHGGSCININCVPTKALIHQASSRPAGADPQEWFVTAVERRDGLVERLRARNHAMLAEVDAVTLVEGQARFVGPRRVEVSAGDDRLVIEAGTVVVNTGSLPAPPTMDGAAGSTRVHDSTSLQHVDPLPRRLVVVGGGYVGLEFASMFARFGSEVTLVDRHPRFMSTEDEDVAEAVRGILEEQGIEILLASEVASVRDEEAEAIVSVTTGGGTRDLAADAVLVATGRCPATADLGLDAAGIATDERGHIGVDEHLRTSAEGVFAVGDVNGGPQFTYVSLDDHRIVLDQLTGTGERSTKDRVAVPSTTFLVPPLARVGLNETAARASGRNVLVAR